MNINNTSRTVVRTSLLTAALALLAASAAAQERGRGGGNPAGVTVLGQPLDKVPVGSWSDYTVKRAEGEPRKVRHALVGKEGAAFILESSTDNQRGRVVTRQVVDADPSKEGGVKKTIMQVGDSDPMEMPARTGQGDGDGQRGPRINARFLKPDPKKVVGKETLKIAAGTFQTERYKDELPRGGTVEYWLAKDVFPYGVVKMEYERPAGPEGRGGGKVSVELAARGKDAKPVITKPAKPFDPENFRRRGDGPGPSAPAPAAAAPSAAPAAPAKPAAAPAPAAPAKAAAPK